MKDIHFLKRDKNFNSTAEHISKLRKSLIHSFRIAKDSNAPGSTSSVEWNEMLSEKNLIWRNGEVASLDSLTESARQAIVSDILPQAKLRNESLLKEKRRKLRHKLKKFAQTEREKGNVDAAAFLCDFSRHAFNSQVRPSDMHALEWCTMTRHQQKMRTVEKFVSVHNTLLAARPNHNATYLQESIFKIPHKWEVTDEDINPKEWIDFVATFLTHYFPKYPIHALVFHGDERLGDEMTGAHVHSYLGAKDSMFGNWDLLKTQIEVVNQYICDKNHSTGAQERLLPENCVLSRKDASLHGERMQSMFREFINANLLNRKGLNVVLCSETERKSKERKEMDRQSRLAKTDRDYNYYHRLSQAIAEKETKHEKMNTLNSRLVRNIKHRAQRVEQLDDEVRDKTETLSALERLKQRLDEDVVAGLSEAIRQAYLSVQYAGRGIKHDPKYMFSELVKGIEEKTGLELLPKFNEVIDAAIAEYEIELGSDGPNK